MKSSLTDAVKSLCPPLRAGAFSIRPEGSAMARAAPDLKFQLGGLPKATVNQQTNNPDSQASLQYSGLKTMMHENSLPTKKCDTEKEKKKKLSARVSF